MSSSPLIESSSPAPGESAKRLISSVTDDASGPAVKKSKVVTDTETDEFDELDSSAANLDDQALMAAAEAAESAASMSSPSRPTQTTLRSSPTTPSSTGTVKHTANITKTKDGLASSASSSKSPPSLAGPFLAAKGVQPSSHSVPKLQPPADPSKDLLWLERQTMSQAWFKALEAEMKKPYFLELKQFLASEDKAGQKTFPPPALIHSWSRLTPIENVKVVVVGQDPYHNDGQACGLSFSVPKGIVTPPSLKNIYKEIQTEYPAFKPPNHGCLEEWAKQGVLLLNACLTVRAHQAGSHHGKGWERLTKHILRLIADEAAKSSKSANSTATANSKLANMFAKVAAKQEGSADSGKGKEDDGDDQQRESGTTPKEAQGHGCKGVVFLAWGAPAAKTLAEAGVTEKSPNVLILRSPHPSPLSAHRGFLGNGHFAKANKWLEQRYGPGGGIDWMKL